MISVVGIALATTALVCVLSVFNGFRELVASLFTAFDPELELVASEGRTFSSADEAIKKIQTCKFVDVTSGSLQNRALARYEGRQAMIVLKGVDDNFGACTGLERILYGNGDFVLHADLMNYAIPGIRIALALNMTTDFGSPLEIYTPRPGETINMMNPTQNFNKDVLNSSGSVFNVSQKQYDSEYVLCPLTFAQKMFEKPGEISSLAIRLKRGIDLAEAKHEIQTLVGNKFKVQDRYEQQQEIFNIMKVEKLMGYVFLTFILFVACFNIIASLSILIIDKRRDILILHDLGMDDSSVRKIFILEGRLISIAGAVIGICIGLLLCYCQSEFGWLRLGQQSGTFIVDAYPVSVNPIDIIIVAATVTMISFAASWYPVKYLSNKMLVKH